MRLAREGYLTREEYARFGRPYDLRVLEAAAGAPLNVLHVCGDRVYFDAVADYPVHAISWNSQAAGNPSFGEAAEMTRAAVMGGVDEGVTLPSGTPEDVTRAAERGARRDRRPAHPPRSRLLHRPPDLGREPAWPCATRRGPGVPDVGSRLASERADPCSTI